MSPTKQVLQDWYTKNNLLISKLSTLLPLTFIFMNNVVWWCLSIEIISKIFHQFQFATCQMNMHRRHHLLPPFWADLMNWKKLGSKVVHSYKQQPWLYQTDKQTKLHFRLLLKFMWVKKETRLIEKTTQLNKGTVQRIDKQKRYLTSNTDWIKPRKTFPFS